MTGKLRGLKIVAAMLIILVLPSLFFTYIGHEPMKEKSKASRQIAVVNDDIGSEFDKEPVNFGQEITPALEEESEYSWQVVSRSTAEKGLVSQEYDAVVYFPSDFSRNILTYDEESPLKASVKYDIQSNLDAKNKEKIQKELEVSKSKMNKHISTLYWSVVSQSVEDIRKKFDKILEKEIAFQDTIYNFYNPNSEKLAEEIDQQRKMIESLFASTKDAGKVSAASAADAEKSKQEVAAFVDAVNKYREYQQKQNEVFAMTAQQNKLMLEESLSKYETMLNDGVRTIADRQLEASPEFQMDDTALKEKVAELKEKITDSSLKMNQLSETIKNSTIEEQFARLETVQKELITEYKKASSEAALSEITKKLIPEREKLQGAATPDPAEPGVPDPEQPQPGNGEALLATITNLKTQAENMKKQLETEPEKNQAALMALEAIKKEIDNAELQAGEQNTKYKELEKLYTDLAKQMEDGAEPPAGSEDRVIAVIQEKEKAIMQSGLLTEKAQEALAPYFSAAIQNKNMEDLLKYHSSLSGFDSTLQRSAVSDEQLIEDIVKNQGKTEEIRTAFSVLKNETGEFNNIQEGLNSSVDDVTKLEDDYTTYAEKIEGFVDKYGTFISEEQAAILADLETIQFNSGDVTGELRENFQTPEPEVPASENMEGEFFVAMQGSAAGDIQRISGLISSLAERQDSIENYTSTLQQKVGSVQGRADKLNNTWAANVDSTRKVKTDVYSLLNNTLVDDQQNGYVYDYLASPVKIDGEVAADKTVNTPPVVMLVIILLCALLIGFFLSYFTGLQALIHLTIFLLLNLAAGLIISIYGLNIYPLEGEQAIAWTVITILLLMAGSSLVRLAFYAGPIVGSIITAGLIVFFITPLLDMVLPNFDFSHPVSNVYLSIQYGDQGAFYPAAAVLVVLTILFTAIPYISRMRELKKQRDLAHEA
ncbi:type VII secretion protein EsaA [Peribacillus sp. SCS-37]|uniref:type VII secretion protein EsaA n=1 Tax=Paraperibacillus esterisolvens TaxID=3115296 RepID=UPI00390685BC